MTAKQLIEFAKKYAYVYDFNEVLKKIDGELFDINKQLEEHSNDCFTPALVKAYKDAIERKTIILMLKEQREIGNEEVDR